MNYNLFLDRLTFSQKGKDLFFEIHRKATQDSFSKMLSGAFDAYDSGDECFGKYIKEFSEQCDIPPEQITFYIYILLSEKTLDQYKSRSISEDIFYSSLADLARNCERTDELYGVYGIQQEIYRCWFRLNFDLRLFRLGRLEFDIRECPEDVPDYGVKAGDTVLGVHIPKGENLLDDECEASYKEARCFFKKYFNMENILFTCASWLMHPWLNDVLPKSSSIVIFQSKFNLFKIETHYPTLINWLFPGCEKKTLDELPQKTSLQRAAVKRMKNREAAGYAIGIRR